MESALETACETARQAEAQRVHVMRMRIGTLSGVVPEALQFAFEALAPGTLLEGARLEIEDVPARFWCGACSREFTADSRFSPCPSCGEPAREIRAGRELEIASLEIE